MKNKLKFLFCLIVTISVISSNGNCQCTDQYNHIIHCIYYRKTDGKYYKIDENNNRYQYLPNDGDIVLILEPKKYFHPNGYVEKYIDVTNDGGPGSYYYVYDKNGNEHKYSPNTFQHINSSDYELYTVALHKDGSVILRPHYSLQQTSYIFDDISFNNIDDNSDLYDDDDSLKLCDNSEKTNAVLQQKRKNKKDIFKIEKVDKTKKKPMFKVEKKVEDKKAPIFKIEKDNKELAVKNKQIFGTDDYNHNYNTSMDIDSDEI